MSFVLCRTSCHYCLRCFSSAAAFVISHSFGIAFSRFFLTIIYISIKPSCFCLLLLILSSFLCSAPHLFFRMVSATPVIQSPPPRAGLVSSRVLPSVPIRVRAVIRFLAFRTSAGLSCAPVTRISFYGLGCWLIGCPGFYPIRYASAGVCFQWRRDINGPDRLLEQRRIASFGSI